MSEGRSRGERGPMGWDQLLQAPHRLAFFLAGVNLLRPILMGRVVSHAGAK